MVSPKPKPEQKPKPKKSDDEKPQSERFKETAKKVEADESGAAFDEAIHRIFSTDNVERKSKA